MAKWTIGKFITAVLTVVGVLTLLSIIFQWGSDPLNEENIQTLQNASAMGIVEQATPEEASVIIALADSGKGQLLIAVLILLFVIFWPKIKDIPLC